MTSKVQEKIVAALMAGNFFAVACAYAGIGASTGSLSINSNCKGIRDTSMRGSWLLN